jgi:anti-sigma-K factor RskA
MKLPELQKKLIFAARANRPSDSVPYAFEKRVMARIQSRSVSDVWALWAQALWRSAGACVAIVAVMGAVSIFAPKSESPVPGDLSQAFEKTMLAALENEYAR